MKKLLILFMLVVGGYQAQAQQFDFNCVFDVSTCSGFEEQVRNNHYLNGRLSRVVGCTSGNYNAQFNLTTCDNGRAIRVNLYYLSRRSTPTWFVRYTDRNGRLNDRPDIATFNEAYMIAREFMERDHCN